MKFILNRETILQDTLAHLVHLRRMGSVQETGVSILRVTRSPK